MPVSQCQARRRGLHRETAGRHGRRLTDVTVDFEGSEAFYEVVWVLIEKLRRNRWPIGGQPFSIRQGVLKGQQQQMAGKATRHLYHRAHADQRQVRP